MVDGRLVGCGLVCNRVEMGCWLGGGGGVFYIYVVRCFATKIRWVDFLIVGAVILLLVFGAKSFENAIKLI